MPEEVRLDQISIKVNGSQIPHELMDVLEDVEVDTSLYLPDMFILTFHDDELRWMDQGLFQLGATVLIEMSMEERQQQRVMEGEVTAIEPRFSDNQTVKLVVRGYDKTHRLNRGTKSRVFVQVTEGDIVSQIAREAGLSADVDVTSEVYEHVFQHNQTDLAFLQERADRLGYECFVDQDTLHFRPPRTGADQPIELDWGSTLRSFTPKLTVVGQVDEMIVKGWDPRTKREIIGKATSTNTAPEINVGGQGGQVASRAFSTARQMVVRRPVSSQSEADRVAQAILDEVNAGFVEAEGVALGNPRLYAGHKVKLSGLGQKFSGTYMMTSAVHIYTAKGIYQTHFRVEGVRPTLMADLIAGGNITDDGSATWGGVVPAVVTNNEDPQNMGRVKLKFPWMDTSLESDWARILAVGAGKDRGLFWLPEVNDEVMVAFEHGDFNRPYVIGNLWNGEDTPPESVSQAVNGGRVQLRTLKTRAGHIIRFSDKDGSQFIEIIDAAQGTHIKLDATGKKLTIKVGSDIEIEAQGNIKMKAAGNINVEATGQLTLKGAMVNIN